jgi:hypothetical protein
MKLVEIAESSIIVEVYNCYMSQEEPRATAVALLYSRFINSQSRKEVRSE